MNHVHAFVVGIAGAVFAYAFGVDSELFQFFILVVGIDIVTGVGASLVEGTGISSTVGARGMAKKAFMFMAILLGHRMDVLWGINSVMVGTLSAYLWVEIVSITENYARVGLPLPKFMRDALAVLKTKSESGGLP